MTDAAKAGGARALAAALTVLSILGSGVGAEAQTAPTPTPARSDSPWAWVHPPCRARSAVSALSVWRLVRATGTGRPALPEVCPSPAAADGALDPSCGRFRQECACVALEVTRATMS